jgi:hypothetical protein
MLAPIVILALAKTLKALVLFESLLLNDNHSGGKASGLAGIMSVCRSLERIPCSTLDLLLYNGGGYNLS